MWCSLSTPICHYNQHNILNLNLFLVVFYFIFLYFLLICTFSPFFLASLLSSLTLKSPPFICIHIHSFILWSSLIVTHPFSPNSFCSPYCHIRLHCSHSYPSSRLCFFRHIVEVSPRCTLIFATRGNIIVVLDYNEWFCSLHLFFIFLTYNS